MSIGFDDEELEQAVTRSIAAAPRYPDILLTGVPSDDVEAPERRSDIDAAGLRAAAVNGSTEAQVAWGHILLTGYGVDRDAAAAARWFQIASRSGSADAYNMLGRCHERGWGVPVDFAKAANWYKLAADQSHAWGQFNLAVLLAQGEGVRVDYRAALALLVKSARQGNPKAMNMIGRYRELGYDREPNIRSAAIWYRWAAIRGCFRGQFHHARQLAMCGQIEAASHWFRQSMRRPPEDFRREAIDILSRHSHPTIRRLADELGLLKCAESAN